MRPSRWDLAVANDTRYAIWRSGTTKGSNCQLHISDCLFSFCWSFFWKHINGRRRRCNAHWSASCGSSRVHPRPRLALRGPQLVPTSLQTMARHSPRFPHNVPKSLFIWVCLMPISIAEVIRKEQMRFRSSLSSNDVQWETLPNTNDLFTTISRRYSHAACYYGKIPHWDTYSSCF